MTCNQNFSHLKSFFQSLKLGSNLLRIEMIVSIESHMDPASFASWILLHLKGEIFDPVLSIIATSPRNNNCFGYGFITNVSSGKGHLVVYMGYIDQFGIVLWELTAPVFQTFFWTVWKNTVSNISPRHWDIKGLNLSFLHKRDAEAQRTKAEQEHDNNSH